MAVARDSDAYPKRGEGNRDRLDEPVGMVASGRMVVLHRLRRKEVGLGASFFPKDRGKVRLETRQTRNVNSRVAREMSCHRRHPVWSFARDVGVGSSCSPE